MPLIQIEVTNACQMRCANCTRFVGHHRKPFFTDLDTIVKAIESLDGYKGRIGLMGGETTLHPNFREICEIYQKMIPDKSRRALWTSGYKWEEYKNVILKTFHEEFITYNDHSDPDEGWHQPLLVAIDEVIEDKDLMWKIINNCWIQKRWSASITPKGTFFCEVAAAQDYMFDGPGGWPIEKGWWNKTPEEFQDQVKRYCTRCSAALPISIPNNHEPFDLVSEGNVRLLEKVDSPKCLEGRFRVVDSEAIRNYAMKTDGTPGPFPGSLLSHPEWTPWNYRTTRWHGPGEGYLTQEEVRALQTGRLSKEEANRLREIKKSAC